MLEIDGLCAPGYGRAAGDLAFQIPRFAVDFPEVDDCHLGTINLILDRPLLVAKPDYRKQVAWGTDPSQLHGFDFLRIEIEAPIGAAPVRAWLYIPHRSLHRKHLNVHEVIAAKLPIKHGDRCRLRIDRAVEELPYMNIAIVM